jgi:NADPH-dependent 2,4-dienoyl-CoA reductase/sulfur reductase-like enzyme
MADAMTRRGLEVTLVEYAPEILTTMDPAIGRLVRAKLESEGIRVITGSAVKSIESQNNNLLVRTASVDHLTADMVLVATGVRPSTQLAQTAGIALGFAGAIQVDRKMNTNIPNILAAGDCAETWHRVLRSNIYMPLGTTAHKQGRVAGENMIGGNCQFQGSLGTQVVKVFDQIAAGTGLRDMQAVKAGYDPLTGMFDTPDRNIYYPGAKKMIICITGDRQRGSLLGAQIVGNQESEIAKRIDIIAAALYNDLLIEDLCSLDLSYSPPLSSPWDPVQKAAMQWNSMLKVNT